LIHNIPHEDRVRIAKAGLESVERAEEEDIGIAKGDLILFIEHEDIEKLWS
jgi:hypothetical protein